MILILYSSSHQTNNKFSYSSVSHVSPYLGKLMDHQGKQMESKLLSLDQPNLCQLVPHYLTAECFSSGRMLTALSLGNPLSNWKACDLFFSFEWRKDIFKGNRTDMRTIFISNKESWKGKALYMSCIQQSFVDIFHVIKLRNQQSPCISKYFI